jgi:cytochrome P450 family 12
MLCLKNLYYFRLAKYFIDKTVEELEKQEKRKPDDEKSVLEKLLDINKDVALMMASDALFAGVDTVCLSFEIS